MANRRKDRPVPDGFKKYSGDYEKTWYTIITINGSYHYNCWPNAGQFYSEWSGKSIPGKQVFAIKEAPYV